MVVNGHEDFARAATKIAHRLRLVQVDFADASPEERQAFLIEEISRALTDYTPDHRAQLLNELPEHFPTWNASMGKNGEEPPPPPELNDPDFLVGRLIALQSKLTHDKKQMIAHRLRKAEVIPPPSSGEWSKEAEDELLAMINAEKGALLEPDRVLQLLVQLIPFSTGLERLVRETWRQIAPKSSVLSPRRFEQEITPFLTGDDEVSRRVVTEQLELIRRVTASLVAAIGQAGQQYAFRYFRKLAPSEIAALAGVEKRWYERTEVACWRKYKELAEQLSEAAVERDLKKIIADYAEKVLN